MRGARPAPAIGLRLLRSGSGRALLTVLAACSLAGCGDDSMSPFDAEINNATDDFQFQATDIGGLTVSVEYHWRNTGTVANVNQASEIGSGTARLRISDSQGIEVYDHSLAENGTIVSLPGAPGLWRIRLELVNLSGTLNFRVQRP